MTSAERFYARHYGHSLRVGAIQLAQYEAAMMQPGQRYSLPARHFEAHPPHGKTLVEVGCGGAEALLLLAQRYKFQALVGIDVALPDSAEIEGLCVLKGDLDQTWPIDSGSADYLLAMMVIEHLYDPFHAFSEVARVLSPQGIAFINLPLVTSLANRLRLALGLLPQTSTKVADWFQRCEWDGGHLHYFSLPGIRRLARLGPQGV